MTDLDPKRNVAGRWSLNWPNGGAMARVKPFDEVADAYDAVRPGYPAAVFDRIVEFGCLRPETKVLEVGVGTGKATVPFAERGFEILGIEPGTSLSEVARSNLARFPRVAIATTTFEAWSPEQAYGLAFSAQAFHWLDRRSRLSRFAGALQSGGVLAVFGNAPHLASGRLRDDVEAAYRDLAPSLSLLREATNWYGVADSPLMAELSASARFRDVRFTPFKWQRTLDGASYCRLLSTYSDHSVLPSAQRRELLGRIAKVIAAHGDSLTLSYTTGLFLARRSD